MPFYEYICPSCGKQFTLQRPMAEASAPASCPDCEGGELRRMISRVHVVKSETERVRDPSWIDRDLARRLRKKSEGRLSPGFKDTLDRMESR
jgi:putative FmdB family regulatory protein